MHVALDEHKKIVEYQSELDDARLKVAQIEISQESWKKKYERAISEKNNLNSKIFKLESELSNIKRTITIENSDEIKLKEARYQVENESLKNKCENLTSEISVYKDKISQLEIELLEAKKLIGNFENTFKKNSEISLNSNELEKELSRYKTLVAELSSKINHLKAGRKGDLVMEQRIKQLETDLQDKNEELERLKEFEKVKIERDQLVSKLKNQAKQFEQYVKNQKQVFAELNLSPRTHSNDSTDFQKIIEIMVKEIREEMEQKVAEDLRGIEERHREMRKKLEDTYKTILLKLKNRCHEKIQEVETLKTMLTEKVKIHSYFKAKEQFSQMVETELETYYKELVAKNLKIEKLEEILKQKESDVDEERNLMAQVMSQWAAEITEVKGKEVKMNERLQQLKESEENLKTEIKILKEKEKEMKTNIDTLKNKYQSAKQTANNYKVII